MSTPRILNIMFVGATASRMSIWFLFDARGEILVTGRVRLEIAG